MSRGNDPDDSPQRQKGKNKMTDLQKYVDGIATDLKDIYNHNENAEAEDLYEYISEALDIEYTISSNGDFLGARIAVTLGGPNVWIDTREGYIKGTWGTDRAEAWIPCEIVDEINCMMEDLYSSIR